MRPLLKGFKLVETRQPPGSRQDVPDRKTLPVSVGV
jgi:hypothetical protein